MARIAELFCLAFSCVALSACSSLTIQPTTALNAMDTTLGSFREVDSNRYIIVTMTNAAHEELVRGERLDREGELPPVYAQFLGNLSRTYNLKRVADWPLGSIQIRCLVFEVADAAQRDATIAALAKERFVETAQPLNLFDTAADAPSSNDPYLDLQPALKVMQISESHRLATGKGVRVAVIDTGVDTHHPDLKDRVVGIRNFVDRNEEAFNADVHGTAVAGVIAATANNGVGLVGVAPEADVLGLKACWETPTVQSGAHCSSFTLAKALNFAIDQNVDVINLSLGGPPDPLLQRLVGKALEKNILVVGASSSKFPNGFPAVVEGVIGVTNAPPRAQFITAPGNQVLSTKPHDEYDFYTGSSFATANVAGVVTLIRQRKPQLSAKTVKDLIETTSVSNPPTTNACRALVRAMEEGECEPVSTAPAALH